MKYRMPLIAIFALVMTLPGLANDKKKHPDRVMIEKMEAVPCGAKERGMTGLGSVFASVGVTSVNSNEKLCPQYLLKSDDMEYHVRPLDKHPNLLPVGKEGEFKLTKDKLDMRIPDGDRKVRHYQVVAMKPIDHADAASFRDSSYQNSSYQSSKSDPSRNDSASKPPTDKNYADTTVAKPTNKTNDYPQ